jgi:dTDP-glucose pyrophosphorylase
MWGIIPAAGAGSRIQPLACSKELLPVGSRIDSGVETPKAVSEYLIERMIAAGVDKICIIISPDKADIIDYYAVHAFPVFICFAVQHDPQGLCDALFRAVPLIDAAEHVVIGLPDTIWYPEQALNYLPDNELSFLLFPVEQPWFFDAVVTSEDGRVREIQVKNPAASTRWIWGAFKMPGSIFKRLYELWLNPSRGDEYVGTLVNSYLAAGGTALGITAGTSYMDVGTMGGYRTAMNLLSSTVQAYPRTAAL